MHLFIGLWQVDRVRNINQVTSRYMSKLAYNIVTFLHTAMSMIVGMQLDMYACMHIFAAHIHVGQKVSPYAH